MNETIVEVTEDDRVNIQGAARHAGAAPAFIKLLEVNVKTLVGNKGVTGAVFELYIT